jgi:hypothetical protein
MSSLNIDQRIAAGPPAYAETYKAAEHFRDKDHEFDSVKFGVWLFLATEVLLFSGLFCYYGIMRLMYPEAFIHGSSLLDWRWGLGNTVVLLCSSFTAAAAVRDAQLGRQFWLKVNLFITLLAGVAFLLIKFVFEYYPKWAEGKLPGEPQRGPLVGRVLVRNGRARKPRGRGHGSVHLAAHPRVQGPLRAEALQRLRGRRPVLAHR